MSLYDLKYFSLYFLFNPLLVSYFFPIVFTKSVIFAVRFLDMGLFLGFSLETRVRYQKLVYLTNLLKTSALFCCNIVKID